MKTTSLVKLVERTIAIGIAGAVVMSFGAALAQTTASPSMKKAAPAASAPDTSKPLTAAEIENWTTSQWEAAKKEWQKDTAKWTSCQEQSNKKKLEGRKSWSFLYTCVTS